MKKLIAVSIFFTLISCGSGFQYYSQHFVMAQLFEESENDKVFHSVAFNAQSGSGSVAIYNNTENPIEIDLEKSFLIVNSQAKSFMSYSTAVNISTRQNVIKNSRFTYSSRFYTPSSVTYYDPGISTIESSNGYMRGNLTSSPNTLTVPAGSYRVIQMPSVLNTRYCSEYNRSNKSQQAVGYTVDNTPLYVEVKIASDTEILSTSKHYCVDYKEWSRLDSERIYNDIIRKGDCASPVVDESTIYFFYP